MMVRTGNRRKLLAQSHLIGRLLNCVAAPQTLCARMSNVGRRADQRWRDAKMTVRHEIVPGRISFVRRAWQRWEEDVRVTKRQSHAELGGGGGGVCFPTLSFCYAPHSSLCFVSSLFHLRAEYEVGGLVCFLLSFVSLSLYLSACPSTSIYIFRCLSEGRCGGWVHVFPPIIDWGWTPNVPSGGPGWLEEGMGCGGCVGADRNICLHAFPGKKLCNSVTSLNLVSSWVCADI